MLKVTVPHSDDTYLDATVDLGDQFIRRLRQREVLKVAVAHPDNTSACHC